MKMQTRGPLPLPERPYDYRHTPAELLSALAQILPAAPANRLQRKMKRCAVPRRSRSYSAFGKRANSCSAFSGKNGHMSLGSMFGICKSRSELVATFLSVLELCPTGISASAGKKEITM